MNIDHGELLDQSTSRNRSASRYSSDLSTGEYYIRLILPNNEIEDPVEENLKVHLFISNYRRRGDPLGPFDEQARITELTDAYSTLLGIKQSFGNPELRKRIDKSIEYLEEELIKLLD